MILKHYTYFNTTGRYRGTLNLFEPEASEGETLHEDGISIVRADKTVFLQRNHPEAKWGDEGLTRVEGAFSALHELVNGRVGLLPVPPPPTQAEMIDADLANMPAIRGLVRAMAARLSITEDQLKTDMKTRA